MNSASPCTICGGLTGCLTTIPYPVPSGFIPIPHTRSESMKLHGDTVRNYNKPINKRKRKATAKTKR